MLEITIMKRRFSKSIFPDIVKKFVDLGCDLNCKNEFGETILFEACERIHNNYELVKYLIDNGADDTIVNCDGKTCWDMVMFQPKNGYQQNMNL